MPDEQDIYDEFEKEADLSYLGGDFNEDESTEGTTDGTPEPSGDESSDNGGDSKIGDEGKGDSSGDDGDSGEKKGDTDNESGEDSQGSTGDGQGGGEHREERAPVIPRARFDEVNHNLRNERERNDALEARIRELEGRSQQEEQGQQNGDANNDSKKPEPIDLTEKEREYAEALVDDDYETAAKIRTEINAEIRRQATEDAVQQYGQQQAREREQAEADKQQDLLNQAADDVANTYPELNMAAETGDQAKVDEVVQWRNFLITSENMPAHEALRVAAKRVLGDPAKENGGGQQQQENKRQGNAINRGLKDSESQPPTNQDGIGARAAGFESPAPEDQEEWERTPQKEREKHLQ